MPTLSSLDALVLAINDRRGLYAYNARSNGSLHPCVVTPICTSRRADTVLFAGEVRPTASVPGRPVIVETVWDARLRPIDGMIDDPDHHPLEIAWTLARAWAETRAIEIVLAIPSGTETVTAGALEWRREGPGELLEAGRMQRGDLRPVVGDNDFRMFRFRSVIAAKLGARRAIW